MTSLPRLVPERPLPPYAYVPGRQPHPVSDPAGHSFGHPPAQPVPLDPECWQASRDYLFGFDLFNHGYVWEAHETWEGLWHAAGRRGPIADFLKGLIKLAAAGVKLREGKADGVRSHAARARTLFEGVAPSSRGDFLGLDVAELIAATHRLEETATTAGAADQAPPFLLRPKVE